jgi:hypothetical protein
MLDELTIQAQQQFKALEKNKLEALAEIEKAQEK